MNIHHLVQVYTDEIDTPLASPQFLSSPTVLLMLLPSGHAVCPLWDSRLQATATATEEHRLMGQQRVQVLWHLDEKCRVLTY